MLDLTGPECRLIADVLWAEAREAEGRDRARAQRLKDLSTKMHKEATRLEGRR